MLSRVAQLAEKTKVLAGSALEALDAPDGDDESPGRSQVVDPDIVAITGFPSAPSTPSPGLEKSADTLVFQLIESLVGQPPSNPRETSEVLTTQLWLLRENATSLGLMDSQGSLVNLLNHLIQERAVPGGSETAQSLLIALEAEQVENARLRSILTRDNGASRRGSLDSDQSVKKIEQELEQAKIETQRLHRMLAKVVKEKADLELEKDNQETVDARVMRSAFASLCANIDNKSVRDNVLHVMAEMLEVSPEDRKIDTRKNSTGLGDEFLSFLNQELDDVST